MALHVHTYGLWLQTCLKLVTQHALATVAVQILHLSLLGTITTASLEIQTPRAPTISCMLMTLSGMASSAVQKVLAAAMEETLHGLVWTLPIQPLRALRFVFVQILTRARTLQYNSLNSTSSETEVAVDSN